MSDLDWQLLGFVHDGRLASGQQIIRALWQTDNAQSARARAGRRTLKRLTDWRVLQVLPRHIAGMRGSAGSVYYTGRAGVRLLAARGIHGPRVEIPGTLHLAHTLATTELALRLREADRDGLLELIEVQQEPVCWRRYPAGMGAQKVLKPDLFIRIGAGSQEDRWMAEVDLGSESGRTIARKLALYAQHYRSGREQHQHRVYPRVLWLVPDERRERQIRDVLARQPTGTQRLFTVCRFDDTIGLLATEARS
ncbi:MAG: replication-relaxation family protein [Solirubrobacteraceae bacterium]